MHARLTGRTYASPAPRNLFYLVHARTPRRQLPDSLAWEAWEWDQGNHLPLLHTRASQYVTVPVSYVRSNTCITPLREFVPISDAPRITHGGPQLSDKARHHAAQLALIEGRLQAVVAKKDATIAALNSELQVRVQGQQCVCVLILQQQLCIVFG